MTNWTFNFTGKGATGGVGGTGGAGGTGVTNTFFENTGGGGGGGSTHSGNLNATMECASGGG